MMHEPSTNHETVYVRVPILTYTLHSSPAICLVLLDTPVSELVFVEDVDEHCETHKGRRNGET